MPKNIWSESQENANDGVLIDTIKSIKKCIFSYLDKFWHGR